MTQANNRHGADWTKAPGDGDRPRGHGTESNRARAARGGFAASSLTINRCAPRAEWPVGNIVTVRAGDRDVSVTVEAGETEEQAIARAQQLAGLAEHERALAFERVPNRLAEIRAAFEPGDGRPRTDLTFTMPSEPGAAIARLDTTGPEPVGSVSRDGGQTWEDAPRWPGGATTAHTATGGPIVLGAADGSGARPAPRHDPGVSLASSPPVIGTMAWRRPDGALVARGSDGVDRVTKPGEIRTPEDADRLFGAGFGLGRWMREEAAKPQRSVIHDATSEWTAQQRIHAGPDGRKHAIPLDASPAIQAWFAEAQTGSTAGAPRAGTITVGIGYSAREVAVCTGDSLRMVGDQIERACADYVAGQPATQPAPTDEAIREQILACVPLDPHPTATAVRNATAVIARTMPVAFTDVEWAIHRVVRADIGDMQDLAARWMRTPFADCNPLTATGDALRALGGLFGIERRAAVQPSGVATDALGRELAFDYGGNIKGPPSVDYAIDHPRCRSVLVGTVEPGATLMLSAPAQALRALADAIGRALESDGPHHAPFSGYIVRVQRDELLFTPTYSTGSGASLAADTRALAALRRCLLDAMASDDGRATLPQWGAKGPRVEVVREGGPAMGATTASEPAEPVRYQPSEGGADQWRWGV